MDAAVDYLLNNSNDLEIEEAEETKEDDPQSHR